MVVELFKLVKKQFIQGVYSRSNLPKIKDEAYLINLDV